MRRQSNEGMAMVSNKAIAGLLICVLVVLSAPEAGEAGQNCWCECVRQCNLKQHTTPANCNKQRSEACEEADYGGMPAGADLYCKWRASHDKLLKGMGMGMGKGRLWTIASYRPSLPLVAIPFSSSRPYWCILFFFFDFFLI